MQISISFISCIIAGLLFWVLLLLARHERLMLTILPKRVIRLLSSGHTYVEPFNMVTVLFSDIVSYTSLSASLQPGELGK